jgi:SAM-dependent methyltransferase
MNHDSEATPAKIQADFDRIARLPTRSWSNNMQYYGFLLRHAPTHCADALDIGCGTGDFVRLLAARSEHVLGIDLSPEMIAVARESSRGYRNIDYLNADVLNYALPADHYDCIVSIATLHHLDLAPILGKMRDALRAGGVLLVLDLFRRDGPLDVAKDIVALPLSRLVDGLRTGRVLRSPEERAAWDEHGRTDRYLKVSEVRRICAGVLPGAKITRHLFWRYSIVWRKME